jgi:hypothetical protein
MDRQSRWVRWTGLAAPSVQVYPDVSAGISNGFS